MCTMQSNTFLFRGKSHCVHWGYSQVSVNKIVALMKVPQNEFPHFLLNSVFSVFHIARGMPSLNDATLLGIILTLQHKGSYQHHAHYLLETTLEVTLEILLQY